MFTFYIVNVAQAGVISDAPSFSNIGIKILNFGLSVVGVIAIIMILISGALYFFAFGDERKMQTAKRSFRNWVIGLFVAMSGMIIVKFIEKILQG